MTLGVRKLLLSLNASYWFIPALLTLAALVLSFLTLWVDIRFGAEWLADLGIEPSRPDGARELLSAISGSMIAVAGTVFAITIAAVVYASGNYGPRLLTNFMTDRGNQLSLGVFIATYVYCLMVLRTIRSPEEGGPRGPFDPGFVPQLSLVVALLLALLSVGVLVYFLHHVPASIRINSVLATIGRRLMADIGERFPDADDGFEPEETAERGTPVLAGATGYVEIIDFAGLGEVAEREGVTIRLAIRAGDFVHAGVALAHVGGRADAQCARAIRDAFALGSRRTAEQDLEYAIDELVEIALRALSPGINDPFTAITSLHWIGAATALLADRRLDRGADGERYGARGVHAVPDRFEHFVRRGFGGVRASAAANALAAKIFIDTLASAASACRSDARRAILLAEGRRLGAQTENDLSGPALAELRERLALFERRYAGA